MCPYNTLKVILIDGFFRLFLFVLILISNCEMIQVVERALNILGLLGMNPKKGFTLSEIASAFSLDKGTCTRIMKTLLAKGYVNQDSPRGVYKLGYKFYHIIGHPVENDELTKTARRDIDALGKTFNETALLTVVANDKRVVLYSTNPDRDLVVRTNLERDVYSVGAGRVIIANYTPSHLDRVLTRLGLPKQEEWPEVLQSDHPEKELRNALTIIKQRGYYILDDKHGITGFAAPLFKSGHVVGCVVIYIPNNRLKEPKTVLKALLDCSDSINKKLAKC